MPASAKIFNEPEKWDYECDVVVIGSGTASYAAIRAANEGLETICVEASAFGGGATGFSGGGGWFPMNKWSVEAGDTKEKMMSYLRNCCREIPITDAQLEAYIDNSQPTIDYYDEIFARCSEPVHSQVSGLFGDYQAEWEGGVTNASHSVSYGGVTKWKNAYLEAIELCGGKLLTSTKATKYVWRYDANDVPEVLGILCEQEGRPIAIKARKAVVCGAGGFDWNDEMKNSFLAVETPYACSLSSNDGTMLKATMELAPKLMNMSECFGQWTYKAKAEEQKAMNSPANIVFGHYFPRQIVVNQKGRRFCDESASYDALWLPFAAFDTFAPYGKTNLPAFEIFDQKFVDEIKGFSVDYFIGDLVDGTFTNGSDERYLAEDWFNRCGFERDDKRTLLWHLLEQNADLENFIELYEENEEYKSHPEEFEEQREEYEMEPGDTFDFEDELQYWLDDWKPSKLSMAEEVEAVRDYVQAMKNFKGE